MRFAGGLTALLFGTTVAIVHLQIATALKPTEISPIAQQITVRIDGAGTGSGVIIERQGNTYTILTNCHVVQEPGSYTVYTPDGKQHPFNNSQKQKLCLPGVDLAVFQFTSDQNYRVAEKGASESLPLGTTIHVAGFPQGSQSISFLSGTISSSVPNPRDGYAFIYTVNAFPDMSGGPILDEQGKLVGIHGRAITRPDTNATTVYGIPLKTYLSFAPAPKPPKPPVATAPAPKPPVATAPSSAKFTQARTLIGHSDYVLSVAMSQDGKTLASGSLDKTIKIWNLTTGKEIRTLSGHSSGVYSVAISQDGKTLASGSNDETIKIWNLTTGKEIRTLKGHSSEVGSVAISPDGKTLASGGFDNTIKIWDLITGKELRTLKGHSKSVWSVAISQDGKTLASTSSDKTTKIWNLATGQEILTLKGHSSWAWSVAISQDSKTLASGGLDKTIKIWNLTTGKEILTLNGHSDSVNSVAFSSDGRTLASGSADATIKIWQLSQ